MSRIGRLPVMIPADVTVTIGSDNVVTVKGPKGTLTLNVNKNISVAIVDAEKGKEVVVTRPNDEKENRALHGLYRKLIANMVEGVTKGYQVGLIVNGVGYKVAKQGKKLVLNVGYSHPVEIEETDGITFECPAEKDAPVGVDGAKVSILVKGIDKERVGQMAANIRSIRIPDPYHVYGIRYADEVVVRKEGKKNSK